jgi:hypothetical protein
MALRDLLDAVDRILGKAAIPYAVIGAYDLAPRLMDLLR